MKYLQGKRIQSISNKNATWTRKRIDEYSGFAKELENIKRTSQNWTQ